MDSRIERLYFNQLHFHDRLINRRQINMAQLTPRELSRAIRSLAAQTDEEQTKPAIVRFADDTGDMKAGIQDAYADALAAVRWYENNDLESVVLALGATDLVPGTVLTKTEIIDQYTLLNSFVAWAETVLDAIYHVPESLSAVEEAPVEPAP